ncbi:MAG: desulfoferrodoxin family protein [Candidatus Thermoplasmatota archaeon]
MTKIEDMYRTDDWKTEKHVPVIEVEKKGEKVKVKASIGKEISHPNETEHHIRWVELYFKPEGDEYPYQLGKYEFTAHGESAEGPNTSTIYTEPKVVSTFETEKSGTIIANSYCNIHGLWTNEKEL